MWVTGRLHAVHEEVRSFPTDPRGLPGNCARHFHRTAFGFTSPYCMFGLFRGILFFCLLFPLTTFLFF